MKSSLTDQLKSHLASVSHEEFIKEWEEIEALGFIGPTVDELISAEYSGSISNGNSPDKLYSGYNNRYEEVTSENN
jgi:hypothetical protein